MAEKKGEKVGFLDPNLISREAHTFPLRYLEHHSDLAAGKSKIEKQKIWERLAKQRRMEIATYIEAAMELYEDEGVDDILAPYFFE